jgi:DNA replication and repair protein RecF
MILTRLTLLNYKNIAEATLSFSPKINCFVGSNGEGKTNVLDAIHFLSFTRSATNTVDTLNIRHGEEMMMLSGTYDLEGVEETFTCGQRLHQKKVFRRGQKAYKRMSEHIGLLPLILVSPNDNELILGGSEERRRFMDMVISQYNATYMASLLRYNKALMQRNALLKEDNAEELSDMMDIYEQMMAQEGEYIYKERARFINELIPVFQHYYDRISAQHEQVGLTYTSHCQRGPLLDVIRRDRQKDLAVGYSLHGIHRDDLVMTLGDYAIKKEGSQGQNKTYLISLKLAQFDFLCQTGSRTKPILLLDDIFDKLDAQRVEQIISLVAEDNFGQIFITDTNREHLDRILERSSGDYKIFQVKGGEIV